MLATKPLNILITAGATAVNIDSVRKITNTSSGATGENIARYLSSGGHKVTLVTSAPSTKSSATYYHFDTYDELLARMEGEITSGTYDVVIHAAAVPDYKPEGVYQHTLTGLEPIDQTEKIPSKHPELFIRLVPTLKIIDLIRDDWGFKGILIKFKLEVGCTDSELIHIARNSMRHSKADYIVANCLEWADKRAIIITEEMHTCISRCWLPMKLAELL